jgi:hypothetical protein
MSNTSIQRSNDFTNGLYATTGSCSTKARQPQWPD